VSDTEKPTVGERPRSKDLADAETEPPRSSSEAMTRPSKPNVVVRERVSRPTARYTSGDEIARGGMGRVVEATDTLLERVVAVKQALTLDPEMLRRFARETKITARLEHPSIVPVYDAGTDGDAPFYVMRRVSGQPLSELIDNTSKLEERLALVPNLLAAAQAVAHAHSRGIVHRDIKPANILVGELGETVVIDWGLAKVVGEAEEDDPLELGPGDSLRTRAGTVFGTPGFMSPEQLHGEPVGPKADVFALGASLYFLLSGRPPHHAPTGDAMMVLAAKGPPKPLHELVPGVPRELATIVETALAYGSKSYPDAAAFAEDLRRFSTGQLVASHHYSRRERLVRFARKHRAAVAISILAVVVIAVLATISFQRVIEERDRADAEARDAAAAQRNERERADQLLLLRARTLVDTNPTEALAVLKELPPSSLRTAEAHALTNAALMRGVPWGVHGPEVPTIMLELDREAKRLLQVGADGSLHIWDFEGRRALIKRRLAKATRAVWVRDRVLLHGAHDTALFDPATGAIEVLPVPKLLYAQTSDDHGLLAVTTTDGDLGVIDPATRAYRRLASGRYRALAVPGDGSWIAVSNRERVVVYTPDGKELTRREGDYVLMRASPSKHLCANDGLQLVELELGGAQPVWREIPTAKHAKQAMMFAYRGEDLTIGLSNSVIMVSREGRLSEATRTEHGPQLAFELGDDVMVLTGGDYLVQLNAFGVRRVYLPHGMSAHRIAARRGSRRFVVASGEVMLFYDLDPYGPHPAGREITMHGEFLDEETALLSSPDQGTLWWHDLTTGKTTAIDHLFVGMTRGIWFHAGLDAATISLFHGDRSELVEIRKNRPEARVVYYGPPLGIYFRLARGALYNAGGSVHHREGQADRVLVTFEHDVDTIVGLPNDRFAAISVQGELARGSATGGPIERSQIPIAPKAEDSANPLVKQTTATMTLSNDHVVAVGWGTKLWKWTDRLELIAELDGPITRLQPLGTYVLAIMPLHRSLLIDLATGARYPLPQHVEPTIISGEGVRALWESAKVFHVFDPAARTAWSTTIPKYTTQPPMMSPSGRRVLMRGKDTVYVWNLPYGEGPLRPRIDRHTNALITAEGTVAWPWQKN
jgi:serine/threonine protein kinase